MKRVPEIFLIHGNDNARKEEVASVIEAIQGTRPTILHEQPDGGKAIIEKLEDHARPARFAVAILTGDDRGGRDIQRFPGAPLRPRARQNVILELGYFWAKLGREKVVILYEPGVELPSDADGVLYKAVDPCGNWRSELAKEMKAAGIQVITSKSRAR